MWALGSPEVLRTKHANMVQQPVLDQMTRVGQAALPYKTYVLPEVIISIHGFTTLDRTRTFISFVTFVT